MKISIWQQFSSNHSNGFQIVGQFATPEEAEKAYAIFLDILTVIAQYNEFNIESEYPTFAETEFGKEYGFDWEKRLNWVFSTDDIVEQLVRFENWVWISNHWNSTWCGAYGIDQIMGKLTSQSWIDEEMEYARLAVSLSCQFKDETQLNTIFDILAVYFNESNAEKPALAPWQSDENIYELYGIRKFEKANNQLILNELYFVNVGISLPAMIQYLQANGAENIQYNFLKVFDWE